MNPQLTYAAGKHHQQDLLRTAQRAQLASGITPPHRAARLSRAILGLQLLGRQRQPAPARPVAVGRA